MTSGDADQIIEHLLRTGMLVDDGGMLSVGPEGERSYGFRRFMEPTSAFTTTPCAKSLAVPTHRESL